MNHACNLQKICETSGQQVARNPDPERMGVHSAFSDLSDVGANRPFAGVTFNKMRRPGTQRTLNTLGLKTLLNRSKRTGSRSSPHVSARLAISPFLSSRTELL